MTAEHIRFPSHIFIWVSHEYLPYVVRDTYEEKSVVIDSDDYGVTLKIPFKAEGWKFEYGHSAAGDSK